MKMQTVVLADASHKLPMLGLPRLFSAAGELVDVQNPYWRALLADGSIKLAPEQAPQSVAPVTAAAPAPVSPAPASEASALAALEAAVAKDPATAASLAALEASLAKPA